jgi:hypothetical protein
MTVPMLEGLTIILPLKFGVPYSSDVRWPVISFSGHLFFYPKKEAHASCCFGHPLSDASVANLA